MAGIELEFMAAEFQAIYVIPTFGWVLLFGILGFLCRLLLVLVMIVENGPFAVLGLFLFV